MVLACVAQQTWCPVDQWCLSVSVTWCPADQWCLSVSGAATVTGGLRPGCGLTTLGQSGR